MKYDLVNLFKGPGQESLTDMGWEDGESFHYGGLPVVLRGGSDAGRGAFMYSPLDNLKTKDEHPVFGAQFRNKTTSLRGVMRRLQFEPTVLFPLRNVDPPPKKKVHSALTDPPPLSAIRTFGG